MLYFVDSLYKCRSNSVPTQSTLNCPGLVKSGIQVGVWVKSGIQGGVCVKSGIQGLFGLNLDPRRAFGLNPGSKEGVLG